MWPGWELEKPGAWRWEIIDLVRPVTVREKMKPGKALVRTKELKRFRGSGGLRGT